MHERVDSDGKYKLTTESKACFDAGQPGQGFVGFIDIETNAMHLYPAFHKHDGMGKNDKNGNEFTTNQYVESAAQRGKQTVLSAHGKAGIAIFGREECMRKVNEGKLLGFGIWKAGIPLLIKNKSEYILEDKQYTPDEYVLVKGDNSYQLYYIDSDLKQIKISIESIDSQINQILKNDVTNVSVDQRNKIAKLIKSVDPDRIPLITNGLKYFKATSTSLNSKSYTYDPLYLCYFILSVRGHLDHGQGIVRELNPIAGIDVLLSLRNENIITTKDEHIASYVHSIQLDHWKHYEDWHNQNTSARYRLMNQILREFLIQHPERIKQLNRYFKQVWENKEKYNLSEMPTLYIICAVSANSEDGLRQALDSLNQNTTFNYSIPIDLITQSPAMTTVFENWISSKINADPAEVINTKIIEAALVNFVKKGDKENELRALINYTFSNRITVDFGHILGEGYHAHAINNVDAIYEILEKKLKGFTYPTEHHLAILGKTNELKTHFDKMTPTDKESKLSNVHFCTILLKNAIQSCNPETVRTAFSLPNKNQLAQVHGKLKNPEFSLLYDAILLSTPEVCYIVFDSYENKNDRHLSIIQILTTYIDVDNDLNDTERKKLIDFLIVLCQRKNTDDALKLEIFDTISILYTQQSGTLDGVMLNLVRASLNNLSEDSYKTLLETVEADKSTSILHQAVSLRDTQLIKAILNPATSQFHYSYLTKKDSYGNTPLSYCIDEDIIDISVLDALLNPLNNHSISLLLSSHDSLLHEAAKLKTPELLSYIRNKLINKISGEPSDYLLMEDRQGKSALHHAVMNVRNPSILKFMIANYHVTPETFHEPTLPNGMSVLKKIIYYKHPHKDIDNIFENFPENSDKMKLMFGDPGLIEFIVTSKYYDTLGCFINEIAKLPPALAAEARTKMQPLLLNHDILIDYVLGRTTLSEKTQRLANVITVFPDSKKVLEPYGKQLSSLNDSQVSVSAITSRATTFSPADEYTIMQNIRAALTERSLKPTQQM